MADIDMYLSLETLESILRTPFNTVDFKCKCKGKKKGKKKSGY